MQTPFLVDIPMRMRLPAITLNMSAIRVAFKFEDGSFFNFHIDSDYWNLLNERKGFFFSVLE